MKKSLKRVLAGTLASLLLAGGFLACSVDSSDDSPAPSPAGDNPSEPTPAVDNPSEPSGTDDVEEEKTGTVSISAGVEKVTVTFKDADYEGKNDDVVITLVSGQDGGTAQIPSWTRDNDSGHYELVGWQSSVSGVSTTSSLKEDVTFTAVWKQYYKVTFVDSAAGEGEDAIAKADDVIVKVYVDSTSKKVELPEFASKTEDYKLSWTSSVDGVTVESDIEQDVTFTATWTGRTIYVVTFKDTAAYDGDTVNADVEVKVYDDADSKKATLPSWVKTHYTATWTSSVDGLTVESDIDQNVTFTATWTENAKFAVTFKDVAAYEGDAVNEDDEQNIYDGEKATAPSWTKTNYTLSWESSVTDVTVDSEITQEVTFTAKWTELPKCGNCGKHYETEEEAAACAVKSGCPKFVAVTEGTYNLTTSGGLFSSQSAGASQTEKGITVTCKIDSKGANLNNSENAGYVKFAIESGMILTFADSNEKEAAVYKVADGGTVSETAETNTATAPSYKYTLAAGTYMIKGTTSSSAKIASLTFESAEFTSKTETVDNTESKLGLVATGVESSDEDIVTAEISGEKIVLKSEKKAGSATITCKATDTESNEITATIAVTVSASGAITTKVTKYSAGGSVAGPVVVALVVDGNVAPADSRITCDTCTVNAQETNGAIEIEYNGTKYKTVKFDSKASITVQAGEGAKITVVGSLPSGKQNCFKVSNTSGETSYKLDSKTTAITTFEKSFTATGNDKISKGDTAAIALIIIEE